jgi:hypothetical protein
MNDCLFLRFAMIRVNHLRMVQWWKTAILFRRRLFRMAVAVEMHNTGDLDVQRDTVAIVEHVLSDRRGDWRVSILGSQD